MTFQPPAPDRRMPAKVKPAKVLEYRYPTTRGPTRWWQSNTWWPLTLLALGAIATLLASVPAGGGSFGALMSLFLLGSGSWYLVARIAEDRRYRIAWRIILAVAAVCSLWSAAVLSAWNGLYFSRLWWSAYGQLLTRVYPALYCLTALIILSMAAWIDQHICGRKPPRNPTAR